MEMMPAGKLAGFRWAGKISALDVHVQALRYYAHTHHSFDPELEVVKIGVRTDLTSSELGGKIRNSPNL